LGSEDQYRIGFPAVPDLLGTFSKKVPAIANGGGPEVFISLILSEAPLLVRPACGLSKTAYADG
jgi:hypothetical protein